MKKIKFFSLLALFTGTLFFSSCNPNGTGIFYSIYTEKKIITSELSNKPVYKIVKAGSKMYVLAGSAVYYENGTTWTRIKSPAETITSDAHSFAVSLSQLNGTTVYAVYEDDSGTNIKDKIYSLNFATVTSAPWSAVSALADSLNLDLISADHDSSLFFINQRTGDGTYSVYSYNGVLSVTLADTTLPVMGASILSSTYYLAASDATGSSKLYSTDGSSTLTDITASGSFPSSKPTGGISENSSKTTLYISTKDGYVYYSTDGSGTTWTKKNSTALTDTSGTAAKLGDMVTVTFNGVPYLIIAGNTGYYEWNLNSGVPQTPSATAADFATYDLSKEMVYSLFYDSSVPGTFYMGAFQGLWINNNGSLNQK